MESNSYRKSDSSGRSTARRRGHVGTGTASRKASVQPEAHPKVDVTRGKAAKPPAGRAKSARVSSKVGPKNGRPQRALSPKQAERARMRSRQRRLLVLRTAAVVTAVALVWGGWTALTHSQVFEIKSVRIAGNSRLSVQDVRDQIALPSGVTLLRVDADSISGKLVRDPWIASVTVKRRFPSTLVVDIQERVPVALVDTGMTLWFVDGDARVLSEAVPSTSTVLPVVRDLPDFVAEPGKASRSETLRNALGVLRGLSEEIVSTVRVVSAPSRNETALLTSASVEIMVGDAVQLEQKSILIRDILAERGSDVVFIDVRSVERPVSRGLGQ